VHFLAIENGEGECDREVFLLTELCALTCTAHLQLAQHRLTTCTDGPE